MNKEELESYDFLINEEDEAMLLLYVRAGEPETPTIDVNLEDQTAVLHRTPKENILLESIPSEVIDSFKEADKLLVCELSIEEDENDTQIVYAYEAEIND